jgi:sugar phosphate permease
VRYRWTILGAGVMAQASFSALLIGLASIAPAIQHRYDLSLAQVGIVLAAVNIGTVLTLLPWGLLADRVGERTTIALGLAGCGGAVVGAAFAESFGALVAFLALAGAVGCCVQSASGRAVMSWFAPAERGLALGIRQTAVPLGGAIAAVLLPALATGPGLRWSFIALAIGSWLGAAVGLALLRDAPTHELEHELVRPLRDRRLWLLCGGSTLYLAGQFAILGFVVLFLHQHRGFSNGTAAGVLAAIQVLGGAARIVAGRWSDRLRKRIVPLLWIGVTLAAALAISGALVDAHTWLLVTALLVAGTLGLSWNGLSYTAAAERAGAARSGASIGIQQTALALGSIVFPIAFAAVVGAASWRLGFLLVALCPLAGFVVLRPLAEAQ